jgi:hypothetical protein
MDKTIEQKTDELLERAGFKPKTKNGAGTRVDGAPATKQPLHDWDAPDWSILDDRRGELPEFPLDCLSNPVRAWVERAARGAGVTAAHVAVPALGIASSLIGMARRVKATSSWIYPMTCWTAVVGASGTGKTPGIDTIKRALAQVERNNRGKIAELQRKHEEKAWVAKAARAQWEKEVKDALAAKKAAPPMPPDAMDICKFIAPQLYVSNTTVERLGELLQARPQGMLLLMDELAALFMNMSRYSGGQDNEFWLEAWNGGSYNVQRVNRPPLHIDHLLVGVVGGVQPDKLARSFERDQDGMYARFLFSWPPAPDFRPLTDEADEFDPDIINAMTRLDRLAEFEDGNLMKRSIELSTEAREEFEGLRKWAHREREALDGREQEWMAKASAHTLRLASTLCLLDWAWGQSPSPPTTIAPEYMVAAIKLVQDYFWPHARACLRQIGLTEKHVNARRVLRWMRARGKREVSIEDVRRDALARKLDATETADLLEALTRSGWVREKEARSNPKGGRRARRWEVNPNLFHPAEIPEIPETPISVPDDQVSSVSGVSGTPSVDMPVGTNGGGAHHRDDLEDCPLAPGSPPDDPHPEWLRGPSDCLSRSREVPPDRRPAPGPSDDGLDMPDSLLRCQHCGRPGAERWNMNGRAVYLHAACEHAWGPTSRGTEIAAADQMEQ